MSIKEQLKDSAKTERKKLKGMPWRDKIWYIYEYYKFHIAGVILLCFAIYGVGNIIYRQTFTEVFSCIMVNDQSYGGIDSGYFQEGFHAYGNFGPKDTVSMDSTLTLQLEDDSAVEYNYASLTKMMALQASRALDVMITDPGVIDYYCHMDGLMDLSQVLPEDLLAQVEDRLYYSTSEDGSQVPCALDISDTQAVRQGGVKMAQPLLAFSVSSIHLDNNILFIRYILDETAYPADAGLASTGK